MWCKHCANETENDVCELCGQKTDHETPSAVHWCANCNIPIIRFINEVGKEICPLCGGEAQYLVADLRPVFPEERLLLEILIAKPFDFINKSVWASNNRYYIDGKVKTISKSIYQSRKPDEIIKLLKDNAEQNSYSYFESNIENFLAANQGRLNYIFDEACRFIKGAAKGYQHENIVLSFSGGKDSTVTADLATRAIANPSLVHIFGDTTLEFPSTMEYVKRFRANNRKAFFMVARNNDQNFMDVASDIGPPARMMRWCCSMFKTGPITRVLNKIYDDKHILTFYGIRKCESVSRSKYDRIASNNESIKIQKQTVASPIFFWIDLDIWLYILAKRLDFNDAYRLGYNRVGCWCCPNNNDRDLFLSKIYMPEQSNEWREFLVKFAKKIGKPDPEVYVDSGKWKARQGGNGVAAAGDVKIKFTNCTAEENAKIYNIIKPMDKNFYELFIPFGKLAPEYGRKLINEMIVLDLKTNVPILSIQPFQQAGYTHSIKVKTMNVAKHDDLQRMVSYQIRKYNACRKCLKCESLCRFGAISITPGGYHIDEGKCQRCKMCVTAKYLGAGCLMDKYLRTKD